MTKRLAKKSVGNDTELKTVIYGTKTPWVDGKFYPQAYNPMERPKSRGKTYRFKSNPKMLQEDPFDIENLLFFEKEKVIGLHHQLEGLNHELSQSGKYADIIGVIGTGGTIAMRKVNGELVPRLDPKAILDELPGSKRDQFRAAAIEFPTPIDSSVMTLDYTADTVILMSYLWSVMSKGLKQRFAGFMVTHGTDTLSESASELAMMLGPNCPFSVGLVGAQKTIEDEHNHVSANISGTLETFRMLKKQSIAMPFVFMNGTSGAAFNPTGIVKISDREIEAFASPMFPAILTMKDFAIRGAHPMFLRELHKRESAASYFFPVIMRGYIPVQEIEAKKSVDPERYINNILSNPGDIAVVLTTFGSFTAHPAVINSLRYAADKIGAPFFAANPFPEGSIDHKYGPAQMLRNQGAIPVMMMPHALRAKIYLGRHLYGTDKEKIIKFMTANNYVNEQSPEWIPLNGTKDTSMPKLGAPAELYKRI